MLGHELGHWYFMHPTKLLCISQVHIFTVLALFPAFLHAPQFVRAFDFSQAVSAKPPTMVAFLMFQVCFNVFRLAGLPWGRCAFCGVFLLFVSFGLTSLRLTSIHTIDDPDADGSLHWHRHERCLATVRMGSRPVRVRAARPIQGARDGGHGRPARTGIDHAARQESIDGLGGLDVRVFFFFIMPRTDGILKGIRRTTIRIRHSWSDSRRWRGSRRSAPPRKRRRSKFLGKSRIQILGSVVTNIPASYYPCFVWVMICYRTMIMDGYLLT